MFEFDLVIFGFGFGTQILTGLERFSITLYWRGQYQGLSGRHTRIYRPLGFLTNGRLV